MVHFGMGSYGIFQMALFSAQVGDQLLVPCSSTTKTQASLYVLVFRKNARAVTSFTWGVIHFFKLICRLDVYRHLFFFVKHPVAPITEGLERIVIVIPREFS